MIVLVLGGARSGKSAVAERLAAELASPGGAVTYLATATVGDDADLGARVQAHRARRPAEWKTVETGAEPAGTALPRALRQAGGVVLVDSLGPWLAAAAPTWSGEAAGAATQSVIDALVDRPCATVVVSEEVGLGVHPSSEVGRHFRDRLGELNQAVAEVADDVLLAVAGRVLRLEQISALFTGTPASSPGRAVR